MGTRSFVAGAAVGAGIACLADPHAGRRRREQLGRWLRDASANAEILYRSLSGSASEGSPASQVGRTRYGARVGDIAGLGAATLTAGGASLFGRDRTVRRSLGVGCALWGFTHRGTAAAALRTIGVGLALGGGDRVSVRAGARNPVSERRRVVDIQKTLFIDASPDQVYAFWSDYRNVPRFMSSVREVEDLGGGRSRWSVAGPGGVPIEWHATLTQVTPGEVIAWRSEPGAMLENAGMIRFAPEGSGTRVDLRICYNPPAGGAGQAVIELLGTDPREMLNDDLGRLKALVETNRRSARLEEPRT